MFNKFHKMNFQEIISLLKGKNRKSILIRDGIWSMFINFSNKALTLIVGILMVRILGKSQYGVYSYVLSLILILIIPIEYGVANLIVRETAKAETQSQPGKIIGIWKWSLKITSIISSLIILVLLFFVIVVGKSNFSPNQINTFLWGLPLLLFQALMHISNAALRGLKKVVLGQLPDLVIVPLLFTLIFIFGWIGFSFELSSTVAMAIRTISTIIAFFVSIIFLYFKMPKGIIKTAPVFYGREWFASVLPLGLSSGLNMVKNHASVLILGFFVAASDIGLFQIAISTASLAALTLQTLNTLLAPQYASLYVNNENKNLEKLVKTSTRLVFGVNLIITIIFLIVGKSLLTLVFGQDTIDAYPALLIILGGQLVNSFVGSVAFLLNMTGYEKSVMKVTGISTIINVIITLILSPYMGILGAATGNAISLAVAQIAMSIIVKKQLRINSTAFGKTLL